MANGELRHVRPGELDESERFEVVVLLDELDPDDVARLLEELAQLGLGDIIGEIANEDGLAVPLVVGQICRIRVRGWVLEQLGRIEWHDPIRAVTAEALQRCQSTGIHEV